MHEHPFRPCLNNIKSTLRLHLTGSRMKTNKLCKKKSDFLSVQDAKNQLGTEENRQTAWVQSHPFWKCKHRKYKLMFLHK